MVEPGAVVLPFDLDATTHIFIATDVQLMTMEVGATLVSMTQDAELVDTVHRRCEAQTAGQASHAEIDQ